MNRRAYVLLFAACICMAGCNSDSAEDTTYEDMTSRYVTYSVAGIWDALENDEDVSGTYILLQGEVYSINDTDIILMDSTTDKTVECTFDSDTDITAVEKDDVVTIGGICRFYSDTTSYPYLDECDYVHISG